MRKYLVMYEPGDDGSWGAYSPDIDGVVVSMDTREEAEEAMRVGIAMFIEDLEARGEPAPEPRNLAGYVAA